MKIMSAAIVALLLVAVSVPASTQDTSPRVVLISIDGLMPADIWAEPATIPAVRALAASGIYADGAVSVLPSLTFAAHTTLITGVLPAVHGILDNKMFDPEGTSNDAWYWYARDIKVPSLATALTSRGRRVASIWWPATVGLEANTLVPEFWRSQHPETLSLLRALSSPRTLFGDVQAAAGRPIALPVTDRSKTDLAIHALKTTDPHLLMLHLGELDAARHTDGPGSLAEGAALTRINRYVMEIVDAVKTAGRAERTTFAVVSDHGFLPLQTTVQPNAAFKAAGLLTADDRGTINGWEAYFHSSGGSGFIYVKNPERTSLVRSILEDLKRDPRNGVRTIWTANELRDFGAHPGATFGLDVQDGFYTGAGHDRILRTETQKGGHGFDPRRLAMHAALVLSGAAVQHSGSVGVVPLTRVAPTLGRILGVSLPPPAAEPLRLTRNE
jgi:predicted AlkP superfamily pyrophosphatase or phosphodiesterase